MYCGQHSLRHRALKSIADHSCKTELVDVTITATFTTISSCNALLSFNVLAQVPDMQFWVRMGGDAPRVEPAPGPAQCPVLFHCGSPFRLDILIPDGDMLDHDFDGWLAATEFVTDPDSPLHWENKIEQVRALTAALLVTCKRVCSALHGDLERKCWPQRGRRSEPPQEPDLLWSMIQTGRCLQNPSKRLELA